MRPPDLASAETLAKHHPHGHKMRYMAGCRCARCRRGNAAYERKMNEDRKLYGPNDLVSTDKVREHLQWLQSFGIGMKSVGKVANVGKTSLSEIVWYGKAKMRRRAANRVLAVRPSLETLPMSASVEAAETLSMIDQLTRWGIPKSLINRDGLGNTSCGLQIISHTRGPVVMVRSALLVREFYRKVERMRAVWISLGNPIPPRHFVYWRPGCHAFTRRSLELRPFPVGHDYHYLYPSELKEAIGLAAQLKKQLRGMKHEERNSGSAQPSIRDDRTA